MITGSLIVQIGDNLYDASIKHKLTQLSKEFLDNEYYISYHTTFHKKNIINVKVSYLRNFFYMDECGYAGFSSITKKKFDKGCLSKVDFQKALSFCKVILNEQIKLNSSKYKQKNMIFKNSFNLL